MTVFSGQHREADGLVLAAAVVLTVVSLAVLFASIVQVLPQRIGITIGIALLILAFALSFWRVMMSLIFPRER